MNDITIRLISLAIGYGFGCLQFAYIIGKLTKNIDIRDHGSGNAGMTNVTRVMGAKFGVLVFVLDVLKSMAAFGLAVFIFGGNELFTGQIFGGEAGMFGGGSNIGLYAALGAILGHNFPFYLKFRGGKGASCTAGAIIAFDWRLTLILFVISLFTLIITRYVSVTSLLFATLFPLLIALGIITDFSFAQFNFNWEMAALAVIICALCWIQHRGNIVRLAEGTERKLGSSKDT